MCISYQALLENPRDKNGFNCWAQEAFSETLERQRSKYCHCLDLEQIWTIMFCSLMYLKSSKTQWKVQLRHGALIYSCAKWGCFPYVYESRLFLKVLNPPDNWAENGCICFILHYNTISHHLLTKYNTLHWAELSVGYRKSWVQCSHIRMQGLRRLKFCETPASSLWFFPFPPFKH